MNGLQKVREAVDRKHRQSLKACGAVGTVWRKELCDRGGKGLPGSPGEPGKGLQLTLLMTHGRATPNHCKLHVLQAACIANRTSYMTPDTSLGVVTGGGL